MLRFLSSLRYDFLTFLVTSIFSVVDLLSRSVFFPFVIILLINVIDKIHST